MNSHLKWIAIPRLLPAFIFWIPCERTWPKMSMASNRCRKRLMQFVCQFKIHQSALYSVANTFNEVERSTSSSISLSDIKQETKIMQQSNLTDWVKLMSRVRKVLAMWGVCEMGMGWAHHNPSFLTRGENLWIHRHSRKSTTRNDWFSHSRHHTETGLKTLLSQLTTKSDCSGGTDNPEFLMKYFLLLVLPCGVWCSFLYNHGFFMRNTTHGRDETTG